MSLKDFEATLDETRKLELKSHHSNLAHTALSIEGSILMLQQMAGEVRDLASQTVIDNTKVRKLYDKAQKISFAFTER